MLIDLQVGCKLAVLGRTPDFRSQAALWIPVRGMCLSSSLNQQLLGHENRSCFSFSISGWDGRNYLRHILFMEDHWVTKFYKAFRISACISFTFHLPSSVIMTQGRVPPTQWEVRGIIICWMFIQTITVFLNNLIPMMNGRES